MLRLICALALVLLIVTPSLGQQSLVGTYKIISQDIEVGGTATQPYGKAPRGYLVLTATRAVAFYTGDNRKFGTSVADKAALFDTLTGWSGTYRVEGGKIIISVDASWTEVWTGKDQVRHWTLSGNRLTLTSDPQPFARDPSKTVIIRAVWEKIELAAPHPPCGREYEVNSRAGPEMVLPSLFISFDNPQLSNHLAIEE